MTPDHYARLCELFDAACDLTAADRSRFLERACGDDATLRQHVEQMLVQDEANRASSFLGSDGLPFPATIPATDTSDELKPGERLGPYCVVEKIASGGMGSVYRATRVEDYKQDVAIKVIKSGLRDPALLRRFQTERQSLARLTHPSIARLLDGGATDDGRPYLVMEFIPGVPLDRHFRDNNLPSRQAASLLRDVCLAVEEAHRHGIIHRDLKPANVLVTGAGVVKVTDFGLARIRQDEDDVPTIQQTSPGAILGTPSYMAPEQARGKPGDVTASTDVWALGAILYDLLTGRPPFVGDTVWDTLEQVCGADPVPPRRLSPRVPRDLETICLKCLNKTPPARYDSAQALADELGRFLDGRPIVARPLGNLARGWRWCKRNPMLASVAGLAILALIALAGVSLSFGLFQARAAGDLREALDDAQRAQRQAEETAAMQTFDRALALCETGHVGHGLLLLARALELAPTDASDLQRLIRANLASWRGELVELLACLQHTDRVFSSAVSTNGKRIVTGSADRIGRLWNAETGQLIAELPLGGPIRAVAFSADDRLLATGNDDGLVRIWDAVTGEPRGSALEHLLPVIAIAFSPDGKQLATGGGATLRGIGSCQLWDIEKREVVHQLPHGDVVWCLAFSGDGRVLISGGENGVVKMWDVRTGKPGKTLPQHPNWVLGAILDHDGGKAVTRMNSTAAYHWDLTADSLKPTPMTHRGTVLSATLGGDGKSLLCGCDLGAGEGEVRQWDLYTGKPTGRVLAQQGPVHTMQVTSDGSTLLAVSRGLTTRVWRSPVTDRAVRVLAHQDEVRRVAFSPDGELIFSCGGSYFAKKGEAHLWRTATGERVVALEGHVGAVLTGEFSPDGQTLLTSNMNPGRTGGAIRAWDLKALRQRGEPVPQFAWVGALAFQPDGATFFSGSDIGAVQRWQTATLTPIGNPVRFGPAIYDVALQPRGAHLAIACRDGVARILDSTALDAKPTDLAHEQELRALAFSPDGGLLVTGCGDTVVRFWDIDRRKLVGAPFALGAAVSDLAYTPDGRSVLASRYATENQPGLARFWDVVTRRPLTAPWVHPASVSSVAITPDGKMAATGCSDGKVRLWRIPTEEKGTADEIMRRVQVTTGVELDEAGATRTLAAADWLTRRRQ